MIADYPGRNPASQKLWMMCPSSFFRGGGCDVGLRRARRRFRRPARSARFIVITRNRSAASKPQQSDLKGDPVAPDHPAVGVVACCRNSSASAPPRMRRDGGRASPRRHICPRPRRPRADRVAQRGRHASRSGRRRRRRGRRRRRFARVSPIVHSALRLDDVARESTRRAPSESGASHSSTGSWMRRGSPPASRRAPFPVARRSSPPFSAFRARRLLRSARSTPLPPPRSAQTFRSGPERPPSAPVSPASRPRAAPTPSFDVSDNARLALENKQAQLDALRAKMVAAEARSLSATRDKETSSEDSRVTRATKS